MAVIASTIKGLLSLVDTLGITSNYLDKVWVHDEVIPALSTLVTRLGSVEQSLVANSNLDWVMWVILLVLTLGTMAVNILLFKQLAKTKIKIETLSKGVITVGAKMNLQNQGQFPECRF